MALTRRLVLLLCFLSGSVICEASEVEEADDQHDEAGEGEEEQEISQNPLTSEQLSILHNKFDQNADGKVSLEEVLNYAGATDLEIANRSFSGTFAQLDEDKDGKLSLGELSEFHQSEDKAHEEAKLKAADINGDGFINEDELLGYFHPEAHPQVLTATMVLQMKQKDKDGDGELSKAEFEEAGKGVDAAWQKDGDFEKLDADQSGKLNLDELKFFETGKFHIQQDMQQLFEVADTDKDGHLSAAEMAEAKDKLVELPVHEVLSDYSDHNAAKAAEL